MPDVTIFHNPACGTSRNTLALLRHAGIEPAVVEYLTTPLSRDLLKALLQAMDMPVRALLRRKGTPYDELGLDDPTWSDEQLLDMVEVFSKSSLPEGCGIGFITRSGGAGAFCNHCL